MSGAEKAEVLDKAASCGLPKRRALVSWESPGAPTTGG